MYHGLEIKSYKLQAASLALEIFMENLIKPRSYCSISANKVLEILKTSPEGLSDFEAQGRLDAIGKNKLPKEKRFSHAVTVNIKAYNTLLVNCLHYRFQFPKVEPYSIHKFYRI